MKRKCLALLLSLLMCAPLFTMTACSESEVNTDAETTPTESQETTLDVSSETTEELSEIDERKLIPDDLPEKTFDGAVFGVMSMGTTAGFDYSTEIIAEEVNGDACNDAVYNRNILIEDRFDITIQNTTDDGPQDEVKTLAATGTMDYHIVGFHNYMANVPIMAESLLNWLDATYVDLDKPWHNSLANTDATINGRLYAICSDLSISSMTFTHAIFANVDLLTKYGYTAENMYDLVKEGKWTIDQLMSLTTNMYVDQNGNGTKDNNDLFGFGYCVINPADVWLTAFGGKVVNRTADGAIELVFMNDKTVSMFDKIFNWHYNDPGFNILSNQYDEENFFLTNRLVMAPMRFLAAYNSLREMESVYTMLPFPKWDEAQEAYYTNADDKFSVFGMPLSVAGDMEFISIIYEALSAESYKSVYPAYYDQALKGKYSSDPTTAEMVDLIMAGRAFDFAFQFPTVVFQRLPHLFRDLINDNNANIASKYKTVEKVAKKSIDNIIGKAYGLK